MKYELVSGFETHIELSTKTKIFCGCTTQFGGEPNTHCCPVCIGLPGTLPVLNREVVRFAIKAGLAVHGEIAEVAKMDRKNYCYPDLSKAYQISQLYAPLIIGGYVELSNGRKIRLHHIHIEEDAGKLIHQHGDTYVDYNRGGVPLIEIVSEPDIRSIDEAKEYVERLQQVMRYIGVSDCKMQEGSMRCDVNISVRPEGTEAFGTRTEIKNMNSITNIARAMEYEYERQVDLIESGGKVVQETLRFDDASGTTSSMRSKEDAHDYRYFRDPDLVTINIARDEVEALKEKKAALEKECAELLELPTEWEVTNAYEKMEQHFEGMKELLTAQEQDAYHSLDITPLQASLDKAVKEKKIASTGFKGVQVSSRANEGFINLLADLIRLMIDYIRKKTSPRSIEEVRQRVDNYHNRSHRER